MAIAIFVRFWFNTTAALPEHAARRARNRRTLSKPSLPAFGRRLADGPKLRQEGRKTLRSSGEVANGGSALTAAIRFVMDTSAAQFVTRER
jgi:hypothetical protein